MDEFDYVVVGGGTAGCVLAARLSADSATNVLLLEAGPLEPVPDMADPTLWWQLVGSRVDWDYPTTPQHNLGDAVLRVPQGKVLGGSSGINGVMFIRGDRFSYDAWQTAGAPGWNYDTLLPYFKRSERAAGRDPAFRGMGGPMVVGVPGATAPLWETALEAALDAGYAYNEDCNAASGEGVSFHENNVVNGKRLSASDAYLTPVLHRPNLTIRGNARVRRLLLEKNVCRGVEYGDGEQVRATREVILTAGAIPTPKLLMLSGIGPADHLRSVGVEVLVDLPEVGANFHDHVKSQIAYASTTPVHVPHLARKPHVMLRSDPSVDPDLHILFADFAVSPRWRPLAEPGYSIIFGLLAPASRGHIRLAGADPDLPPIVDPNLLAEPADLDRMVRGLHVAREIGATAAFAPLRKDELFPGAGADLRAYIRATATSYTHVVGTCRIGAVVDPDLKVYGVENLRIADASVMPSVPAANTNPAVLAIAERAVDLITCS
jgi:choline dehydrogenase